MEDNKQVALIGNTWDSAQLQLIKDTVAKGTTDNQLKLFLYTCHKTGLDPLAKQIHCIVRQTKNGPTMSIQTAIDGYRLVADRSGQYAGNDDPIYDDEKNPRKATVTVYKLVSGMRCGFTATARWDQYYPGDLQGFMWKKMPHLMLGKCAEALALRKAFPAELSGLYTNEEMQQAEVVEGAHTSAPSDRSPQRKSAEPTQEELEAKAAQAKAAYHAPEATKPPPAKPQTTPVPDKPRTETGSKFCAGVVTYANEKENAGGYRSFAIEGQQTSTGRDMMFQTKSPEYKAELLEAIQTGQRMSIQYNEVPWGTPERGGLNFQIVSVAKDVVSTI